MSQDKLNDLQPSDSKPSRGHSKAQSPPPEEVELDSLLNNLADEIMTEFDHTNCQTELQRAIQLLLRWREAYADKRTETVDRFEVIDDTGRAYVKGSIYGSPVKVELSYQDANRTLKVFVSALRKQQGGLEGQSDEK